MHRRFCLFTLVVTLAALPETAYAGPPDQRADKAKKELDKANEEPERSLRWISDDAMRERVKRVKPFVVVVEPIQHDRFANDLFSLCGKYQSNPTLTKWGKGLVITSSLAQLLLINDEANTSAVSVALADLRRREDKADQQAVSSEIRSFANQVVSALVGYRQVCDRIDAGQLDNADVSLLRRKHAGELDLAESTITWLLNEHAAELTAIIAETKPEKVIELFAKISLGQAGRGQAPVPGLPSMGAIGQQAFEGLAEFLIDRAKQEAIDYLRGQFVDRLCHELADPVLFIPKTCEVLKTVEPTMSLTAMGALLHRSLVEDLELLPDRAVVLTASLASDAAYAGTVVRTLMPLVRDNQARQNPLEFATSIHRAPKIDCEDELPKVAAALELVIEARKNAKAKAKAKASDEEQKAAEQALEQAMNVLAQAENDAANGAPAESKCVDTMAVLRLASAAAYTLSSIVISPTQQDVTLMNSDGRLSPEAIPYVALGLAFGLEAAFKQVPELAQRRILVQLEWENFEFDADKIGHVQATIVPLVNLVVDIEGRVKALRKRTENGNEIKAEDMFALASVVVLNFGKIAGSIMEFSEKVGAKANGDLKAGLAITNDVLELAQSYAEEDWAGAALGTVDFVLELARKHEAKSGELDKRLTAVRRYLPLFIEIANAESSDQVNMALQAAFPAGGYKRKYRQTSLAINGMLGAYGGGTLSYRFANNSSQVVGDRLGGEFSLFAPIGLHVTWPVAGGNRKNSLGLMIPVIDLGAITTSKWLEQEQQTPVDITTGTSEAELGEPSPFNLAGLVAPGAYFTVGIRESPFVFGFGASLSPFAQKRTITRRDTAGDIESTSEKFLPALRFGVFLAVDITFVSFGLR